MNNHRSKYGLQHSTGMAPTKQQAIKEPPPITNETQYKQMAKQVWSMTQYKYNIDKKDVKQYQKHNYNLGQSGVKKNNVHR